MVPDQPKLFKPAELEKRLEKIGDKVPPFSSIHGLLTAVAAGPEPLAPAKWLNYVFSADGKMPNLDGIAGAESIVMSIFGLYNDIVAYLDSGDFQPYLGQNLDPDVQSQQLYLWCIGFSKGMNFQANRWLDPKRADLASLLVPIYYFIDVKKFETLFLGENPSEEDRDDLATQMLMQLPSSVLDIYEYWRIKS